MLRADPLGCKSCLVKYNLEEREPYVNGCGHGICKKCIVQLKVSRCDCGQPIEHPCKNFDLIEVIEEIARFCLENPEAKRARTEEFPRAHFRLQYGWENLSVSHKTRQMRLCPPNLGKSPIHALLICGYEDGTLSLEISSKEGPGNGKKLREHLSICGIERERVFFSYQTDEDHYSPTFYPPEAAKVFRFLAGYHEISKADFILKLLEAGDWRQVTPLTEEQLGKIRKTTQELL